ncbi:MAG: DUF2840 domain-containing protein [Azospirillum sp.]|nr:DUF2840 domain-containing protein [Azospirillum sp.]
MSAANSCPQAGTSRPSAVGSLTTVELVWVEDRINHWLRFGRPAAERFVGRSRRVVSFAAGAIFGYLRWEGNQHGTTDMRLAILAAVEPGTPIATVPGVRPGGELLLRLSGWPRIKRGLAAIDAVETHGFDAADVSPDYWRHLHNRLLIGELPRVYGADQHRAWLLRRRISP